ncbi:hypothetical protein [Actinopolymorpha pittospori]|uniref:Uncharacterized protein n=1 Tax=Actinopolymorpha pittospori TaxID=648752 RepID=A0A927N3Z5_9ACTN|nr:hypothetical protein [Actinopolymorpha pittospori]MBE1612245.1 hypothetical protein [Actinopolymorpha pittospori]
MRTKPGTRLLVALAATAAAGAVALTAIPGAASAAAPTRAAAHVGTQAVGTQAVGTQAVGTQIVRSAAAVPPVLDGTVVASFDAFDANQAIAVDKKYFYAVNNRTITKHDKATGKPLLQFAGASDGPIIHMDSGAVVGNKLYVAHSNYDESPMESSIEVFDTETMRHVGTHSFGIYRGSLTWLDRHDGAWWAGFANYDVVPDGESEPYGETYNTQVVKMDNDFQAVESWTIPTQILDRFKPMSNSGGSWGPDGRLYLTGHDLGEAYVMKVPAAGAELEWVATVELPEIQGQGIAWDRSGAKPTLWGISRADSKVISFSVPYRNISDPERTDWEILGPGEFQQ